MEMREATVSAHRCMGRERSILEPLANGGRQFAPINADLLRCVLSKLIMEETDPADRFIRNGLEGKHVIKASPRTSTPMNRSGR
jgi:hypothetical protein